MSRGWWQCALSYYVWPTLCPHITGHISTPRMCGHACICVLHNHVCVAIRQAHFIDQAALSLQMRVLTLIFVNVQVLGNCI